ncbi:MAG: glycosyltransferase [Clostridia bacterium]|nr:glycosyltransferase [Clostridia bacterium]
MKVLILSCNTGEGHNASARALRDVFLRENTECSIADALDFISPVFSKMMAYGHRFVYRHLPRLFNWGYHYAETHPALYKPGTLLYRFLQSGSGKLADYINEHGYDTVISAHVFAGIAMTEAKAHCCRHITTGFMATDYTCSPIAEVGKQDVYMIPDERLRDAFAEKGIDNAKISAVGIPVREMFYSNLAKEDAKPAEGVAKHHTHLLVMGGSMGCGPLREIVSEMAELMDDTMEMTVVCGNNKRLYRYLTEKTKHHPQIHIRGYVENMSRLMDSADVYLTKPGGISVTEASVKKLPMVLINAVGGCEAYNYRFFLNMGTAVSGKDAADLAGICADLLRDENKRNAMREKYTSMVCCTAENALQTLRCPEIPDEMIIMNPLTEEEGLLYE